MTKLTTKQTGISSLSEFEAIVDSIADLTVTRDKKQAKLDAAILAAREQYGDEIAELNNQIAAKLAQAETYATKNQGSLLSADKRSRETTKATWGFRVGNPTLVLLSRKFNWKLVAEKLIAAGKAAYIKIADPKPDKDKIKADFSDEDLASFGLRVEQTESFWIEPKTDSGERLNAGGPS